MSAVEHQELVSKSTEEIVNSLKLLEKNPYDEKMILDSLEQMYRYIPLKSEVFKKQEVMRSLIQEWFGRKIGHHYERLSKKIFDLERKVKVDIKNCETVDEKNYQAPYYSTLTEISVPVFSSALFDGDYWEKAYEATVGPSRYKFKVSARVPKIPAEIREEGRRALVLPHRIYADAMETPLLGDLLLENPAYAPHPESASVLVFWKAKSQDLKLTSVERVDKDPLLVLNWDNPYLVAKWLEPDEEPFEHLLPYHRVQRSLTENYKGPTSA